MYDFRRCIFHTAPIAVVAVADVVVVVVKITWRDFFLALFYFM